MSSNEEKWAAAVESMKQVRDKLILKNRELLETQEDLKKAVDSLSFALGYAIGLAVKFDDVDRAREDLKVQMDNRDALIKKMRDQNESLRRKH